MKLKFGFLLCSFLVTGYLKAQTSENEEFNSFFLNKTLRIDYLLVGNDTSEKFILKDLKTQGIWAGHSRLSSINEPDKGNYQVLVYDSATSKLLYKYGFSTLFQEWQATPEAHISWQGHYQVNLIPFPIKTIRFELRKSNYNDLNYSTITQFYINPTDKFIRDEKPSKYNYTVIQGGNNNQHKVDIAFVAEGYTRDEMSKFRSDCRKIWDYMSSIAPYNDLKDQFNVFAVESPSIESGTDIPVKHTYKNTLLDFSFSTFDIDRYLTTPDVKAMYDVVSVVPVDFIFVLINSPEYGGGGFYNYFTATTVDHKLSLKVAVHEFGHCFGGLADEYYSSSVAVENYYSLEREPWEPNITTLVDFKTKWQTIIDSTTPIPTPRIQEFENKVGVFEGGGYVSKGVYSPYQDCVMKSNNVKVFCPVCEGAIRKTIYYLCE